MDLIFATGNLHKLAEVQAMMPKRVKLTTPAQHGITEDIPENEPTIEGNARAKSMYIYDHLGANCFADDTGLEVQALGGEPGVYSARYAGLGKSFEDNVALLLHKMEGKENRKARFRTVISLIIDGTEHQFQGHINGTITAERLDNGKGFGYDPIFLPDGYTQTFAQMPMELKNKISHRAIATAQLIDFLKQQTLAK